MDSFSAAVRIQVKTQGRHLPPTTVYQKNIEDPMESKTELEDPTADCDKNRLNITTYTDQEKRAGCTYNVIYPNLTDFD